LRQNGPWVSTATFDAANDGQNLLVECPNVSPFP